MTFFLRHVRESFPDDFILMVYDGAPCHSPGALDVPQGCSMLLNQFILRSFQIIGCADAFADISRRDT